MFKYDVKHPTDRIHFLEPDLGKPIPHTNEVVHAPDLVREAPTVHQPRHGKRERESGRGGRDEAGGLSYNRSEPPRGEHQVKDYVIHAIQDNSAQRHASSPFHERLHCEIIPKREASHVFQVRSILEEAYWLVGVVDSVYAGDWLYLFTEPTYGTLLDEFLERRIACMTEDRARGLFSQIACIVEECHHRGVLLRDLTLQRLGFADRERTELKLLSVRYTQVGLMRDDTFSSPVYACPEMIRKLADTAAAGMGGRKRQTAGGCYSGVAADIWSLGVVLYVLLAGRYPFQADSKCALVQNVLHAPLALPAHLTAPAKWLVAAMLERQSHIRPTAFAVRHHDWLRIGQQQTPPAFYGMRP